MTIPLRVFVYLNADKSNAYRAVMQAFMEAKARFSLHLRPADVMAATGTVLVASAVCPDIEALLGQLCDWGNIERHPDTSDVATVEDFYRPRHLYQLTATGEAAERAIAFFIENLQKPGELQATALDDIRLFLSELGQLACADEMDEAKIHRTLKELVARFDELTSRAHAFIGSLQRTIDLHGIQLEAFLAYKQTLIDYLERFIGELTVSAAEIAERLIQIETYDVQRLLQVATSRDLADSFNPGEEDRQRALAAWQGRWNGLRSWFVRHAGRPSQAEILRARARSAIPALLNAVVGIHDRRATRSDRTSDLRSLARWFAEAGSDEEAHQLWRAAFALAPARHLHVDQETLDRLVDEPTSATTSWLDAPPVIISPRLRQAGRHAPRGAAKCIIDRSREKSLLAEITAAETAQFQAARERLATGRMTRLSEVGHLNQVEFALFLDVLGEALSKKVRPEDTVEATSRDGTLTVRLAPTEDRRRAVIETSHGTFSGPDHYLYVTETFSPPARGDCPTDGADVDATYVASSAVESS